MVRFPRLLPLLTVLLTALVCSLDLRAQQPIRITMMPGEYLPGRRPVGVGERLTGLREAVEEYQRLHPHVRIELRPLGGADMVEGEYIKTQIHGGMAPDIVQVNTETVWQDIDKGWWIELDEFFDQPNPYAAPGEPGSDQWWNSFANVALTKAKRAPNGKLYSLTFDLVETGIFYNKDLFRKLGIDVPETWEEFLRMQRVIKEAGYVPFALTIRQAVDWGQDYLFDQFYYPIIDHIDRIKGTDDEEAYMRGYLYAKELCWNIMNGNISAGSPRYREMWRVMREWRDFWPRDIARTDNTRLFLLQRSPMLWDASPFVRRLIYDDLVDFEWGVFYLPPITKATSELAEGVDPAVIGGAGIQYSVTKLARDRGHLDQVMDFLAFLSTPERGGEIVNEASMFIPNFAGVEMKEMLAPFSEIITYRYGTTKWTYTLDMRFNDTNHRLIELFLGDALSLDEFLVRMDRNNREAAERAIRQNGWTFSGPEWQAEAVASGQ
jgi:raffinose/stachyose/melibiose transport system substrate-binding protein